MMFRNNMLFVNILIGDVKANPSDLYQYIYINSKIKDPKGILPLKTIVALVLRSQISKMQRNLMVSSHMGLDVRKPVFGGLRTIQASGQSDQHLWYSPFGKYNM